MELKPLILTPRNANRVRELMEQGLTLAQEQLIRERARVIGGGK